MAAAVVLFVALAIFGGLYAALAPSSQADVQAASSTQIQEGRDLFLLGCSSCHGLGGEGQVRDDGKVIGPSLIGVGAAAVDFQVGTGRMPAGAPGAQVERGEVSYTDEQIAALAAYVASLAPGPAIPDDALVDPARGDVARGGEIFRTNCAQCHNTSGQGGALSYGKFAPPLAGVEPRHIYEAMLTGPQQMPVFGDSFPARAFALTERPGTDFSPGAMIETGRDLDVAVSGDGWMAVQNPDGGESYVRSASMNVDALGVLRAGNGMPIMGNGGPIAVLEVVDGDEALGLFRLCTQRSGVNSINRTCSGSTTSRCAEGTCTSPS
jgi:mono/diheme cytochrome c family protein